MREQDILSCLWNSTNTWYKYLVQVPGSGTGTSLQQTYKIANVFATSKANPETMCKKPKSAATFGFDDDDDSDEG